MAKWIRRLAWYLIDLFPSDREDRIYARRLLAVRVPDASEVHDAIVYGCIQAGVRTEFSPDTEFGPKTLEVLHHASKYLGNEIRTADDIRALLL